MAQKPQSIVHIRPDTIGDLVIFSSVLAQLEEAWPEARQTIVVRRGYEALAPLFSPRLRWQTFDFNPFSQNPFECKDALAALLGTLEALSPDLIVAGSINRTWFEPAVAAHFPTARRVALGDQAVDPLYAARLRLELGVDAAEAFTEVVPVEPGIRDWENNNRLLEQLVGRPFIGRHNRGQTPDAGDRDGVPQADSLLEANDRDGVRPAFAALRRGEQADSLLPAICIPPAATAAASAVLDSLKLPSRRWVAVFAGGLVNVPIKAWPDTSFAQLVGWLEREHKLPVLLMGHQKESEVLEAIAAEARTLGASPKVWLGQDGELSLMAALLADARAYVGNDTGAMHAAAAAGRPVAGIFGGGHWPRFRPAARQGISIVHPLPCFGCNWDCQFGNAPCVKVIPVADVQAAVDELLAAGDNPIDAVRESKVLNGHALALIAAVTPRYRALQRDRIDRQHRIEELKSETDGKDAEIAGLKSEADTKDAEISDLKRETDGKDAEIAELKVETDGKDVEIADLKRAAEERRTEMEAIKAELEEECAQKDVEIGELKGEADTKDAEIAALKATCNEREQLIFTLTDHIRNFQKIVAELNADREARAEAVRSSAPTTAADFAQALADKDIHIRNLEAHLVNREADLAALRRGLGEREASLSNHVNGFGALEASKHYGRLLAEKEAVIQNLHKACVEREKLIGQLAAESTAPTAGIRKLVIATNAHAREKWWRPFDTWLFRKVVEDYWMQIGVLRHYDPRPIKWDRLPRLAIPDDRLPQLGIVTPSYNQAAFVGSTIRSVLDQSYPKLRYVVQDGGSTDGSAEVIAAQAARLAHWESVRDKGQADAVRLGFRHLEGTLQPGDVMFYLNSDDLVAPRALRFVAEYFATHPEVDCVYGHRIIIDAEDREVGRWIMPKHDPRVLEWIDYVPQETLFWRKRAWDLVGGIDPSFQFALDWDLLARFTQAGLRVVRLPYFLGCFRVHPTQKTSAAIHTTGAEEMARIRSRFHGPEKQGDMDQINTMARQVRFKGALTARLHALGIRF